MTSSASPRTSSSALVSTSGGSLVLDRVGAQGRAQLTHERGGRQAPAHHVADDDRGPPAGQRDDVVPVPADALLAAAGGQVAGGGLETRDVGQLLGQQAVLQQEGALALAPVQPGVVDRHGGPVRELAGEQHLLVGGRAPADGVDQRERTDRRGPAPAAARRWPTGCSGSAPTGRTPGSARSRRSRRWRGSICMTTVSSRSSAWVTGCPRGYVTRLPTGAHGSPSPGGAGGGTSTPGPCTTT